MHWLFSILTTLFLLPALAGRLTPCAAGASEIVCHDARGSLVFDEAGDLAIAANDDAVSRFAYDDGHRVVSAETLVGSEVFATAWRYDAGGLVTNVVYVPGKTLTKTYDTDGRLASVSDWLGHVWTFAHDGAGKPTGGTSTGGLALAYDAQGWLVSGCPGPVPVVPTVPDVPSDVLGAFAYDALGLCAGSADWTRVEGFFEMIGGRAEAAAGAAFALGTAETGVGVAAGVAVAIHGADVATAGAYKLWHGEDQDTLTSQGLQAMGVPQDWANGVDAGISIVGSAGVGMATKR